MLTDLTIEFSSGSFTTIVGPTGCGKSTILNLVSGLLQPSDGVCSVDRSVQGHMSYLFQGDTLLPWRTAAENVALPLVLRGTGRAKALSTAHEWLARVGLRGFESWYPLRMSGGMRKRAALAQALIHRPRLLLMDEPFGPLDAQTRLLMQKLLLELWEEDKPTVIFITHDLDESITLADSVVVMSAAPASTVILQQDVNLSRPRELTELRFSNDFQQLYGSLWDTLRVEVARSHDIN